MNGAGKGIIAFFGGVGALMVLVGSELKDRGGETGDAAGVFVMIGLIWTAVAIVLVIVFVIVGRSAAHSAQNEAELMREPEDSDG